MSKRFAAVLIGAAGAVVVFGLVLGVATSAAATIGMPAFVAGIVSCALLGAGLGAVPHALAARSARARDDGSATTRPAESRWSS